MEKLKNNKKRNIILIAGGIVALIVIIRLLPKKPKGGTDDGDKGSGGGGGGGSKWKPESFPLTINMYGNKVKAVQKWLNNWKSAGLTEDGYFGQATQTALLSKLGVMMVSKSRYKKRGDYPLYTPPMSEFE